MRCHQNEYKIRLLVLLLFSSHHYCCRNLSFFNCSSRSSFFYSNYNFISNRSITSFCSSQYTNSKTSLAPVLSATLILILVVPYYLALSIISTNLQHFDLLKGRVSMILTVSPSLQSFFSSCATYFFVFKTNFPYIGCFTLLLLQQQ